MEPTMVKAVFLDLDNTLALYDELAFYERYFTALEPHFSDLLAPADFRQRLMAATFNLARNDGGMTNAQFFLAAFEKGLGESRAAIWRRFLAFYEDGYERIPVDVMPPNGLEAVMAGLFESDLVLVVATNPMFPLSAQARRLGWAGLDARRFDLVTHIDNMGFVKPRSGYYREICKRIGVPPGQCVMVGNDRVNDMAAGNAGLRTYLTTDAGRLDYGDLIPADAPQDGSPSAPPPDRQGPLADLPAALAAWAAPPSAGPTG
jgi:FMN phosphatase YigB (HAD superfamily)